MKDYLSNNVRNVVLLGHSGAGKTSLVEACLFLTKTVDRLGKTSDGSSYMDYDSEEIKRRMSIYTSLVPVEYNGTKINFIDAPGYLDYEGEKVSAVEVADFAIIVVSAKDGIEAGTESAFKLVKNKQIPTVFFINKMDDENANFEKVVDEITRFGSNVIPFVTPVVENHKMVGSNCVLDDPNNLYYDHFAEAIATADDELMEKFFEGEPFSDEENKRFKTCFIKWRYQTNTCWKFYYI
jgi:small GTP-binding protein domain